MLKVSKKRYVHLLSQTSHIQDVVASLMSPALGGGE
jgi:hypothetical protein